METTDLGPCDHIMVGSKIWPALLQNSLSLLLGPEPDGLPCLPCLALSCLSCLVGRGQKNNRTAQNQLFC